MKVMAIFCIFFTCLVCSTMGGRNETELFKNNDVFSRQKDEVTQILKQMTKFKLQAESFMNSIMNFTLPYFKKLAKETNLTESCKKSSTMFLKDLLSLKEWTLRMLDSFGKPSSGLLEGTFWIRGDYDQCLNIKSVENETPLNEENEVIHGKYCVIKINFPSNFKEETLELIEEDRNNEIIQLIKNISKSRRLPLLVKMMKSIKASLRFDACVPSTCTKSDLENIAKYVLYNYQLIEVNYCETKQKKITYSIAQVICIISFSFFFIWVILSTIIDIMLKMQVLDFFNNKNAEMLCQTFSSVSAFKSINKLFDSYLSERSSSLCGMKTLLMYLYMYGHVCIHLMYMATVGERINNFSKISNSLLMEISSNAILTVETFFFISGYLTLYVRTKEEETSIFQYIIFLVKRIISLTIPVLCTLATAIVFPLISDGPHWAYVIGHGHDIEKNWWQYTFHIQNFLGSVLQIPMQIVCLLWFSNVLVQLTILTFPLIFIHDRWPKCGKCFLIILILAGFITYATLMLTSKNYAMIGCYFDNEKFMAHINQIYTKPYGSHLSSYCFGMLIGLIFSNKYELKINKNTFMLIWIAVFALMGLTLFGTHGLINETFPNETMIILHKLFSPYAWTIGVAWICITSATRCGGPLHWFLSLKIFLVLDRLNVWIYSLHPFAIFLVYGQLRNGIVISEINLWMTFAFTMLFSLVASFLYYVFLQHPLNIVMEKLFGFVEFKKHRK